MKWDKFWPEKLTDETFYVLFKKQPNKQYLEVFGNSKELPNFDNTWKGCKIKTTAS